METRYLLGPIGSGDVTVEVLHECSRKIAYRRRRRVSRDEVAEPFIHPPMLYSSELGESKVANADATGRKAEDLGAITLAASRSAQPPVGGKHDHRVWAQGDLGRQDCHPDGTWGGFGPKSIPEGLRGRLST